MLSPSEPETEFSPEMIECLQTFARKVWSEDVPTSFLPTVAATVSVLFAMNQYKLDADPAWLADAWLRIRRLGIVPPAQFLELIDGLAQADFGSNREGREKRREKVLTYAWITDILENYPEVSQFKLAIELEIDPGQMSRELKRHRENMRLIDEKNVSKSR